MTRYELYDTCWNIIWNSRTEKGKQFIENQLSWKEAIYSTLVSWISTYLAGKKFYVSETADDKATPYTNMAECLHDTLKAETNISLNKSTCDEVLLEVRDFKGGLNEN